MLFTELRASIVARLRRAMPKEVRVLPHPGPLDEESLSVSVLEIPACWWPYWA